MCGILGSINRSIGHDLLNTIKHRGPDRQAIYTEQHDTFCISFAHARLSIVDLSDAGNQPMISECGNYILVFNGEIYNHQELRQRLRFNAFKGHSDTETLLYFLIENGEAGIKDLNGIFGFAFWDKRKKRIILARDSYGVKPVYYYLNGKEMIFSSEIRPILGAVRPSINMKALGILLNLRYVPSPYTLYKEVMKVRPGHYISFSVYPDKIEYDTHAYVSAAPKYKHISFEDAVEEYGNQLQMAVRRQLMGDVDMGVLLSGGIDSALIAGLATPIVGNKMKAFTVGFDSQYKVNEIELAADTARHFGMEHHVVKMNASNFFESLAECCSIVEEPLATPSFVPMYYLSKLASEHVKVVLAGQGADEPLGGYGRYQGEILHGKYPPIIFQVLNGLIKLSGNKKESLLRGARSLSIKDDIRRFMNIYSLFTTAEVKNMIGLDVEKNSCELIDYYYSLSTHSNQSSVDKMMAVDLRMNLSDDLLLYTDKVTMNFSLECRVPMLDLELVNYIQSLPTEYKVQRGRTKIIHKAFAEKILPKSIIERPKFAFQSPADIWFRDKSDFIESTLLNGKLKDYLSPNELKKVVDQHRKGYNRETQIFLLLSINEWLISNG